MKVKMRIQELDIFNALSEEDQAAVLQEYKKGYHALLFHGRLIVVFIAVLSMEYLNRELNGLAWMYRFPIYAVLSYLFFIIVDFIEINLVANKVISNLAKDLKQNHPQ
ncbi:MAG: hypothetical protein HY881_14540 [Deltaproteobacteria bacterium]|nr:hypothetical protein [Deltaproteobacteria bacterium]